MIEPEEDANEAPDPSKVPVVDLVGRDFDRANIDELWIGDAKYIWTDADGLYLATVINACSRRLPGWSIADRPSTEPCLDAIQATVATRGGRSNLAGDVVLHADRALSTPPTRSRRTVDHFASDNR